MFCSNCGSKLSDNSVFCGTCGAPVNRENDNNIHYQETEVYNQNSQVNVQPSNQYDQNYNNGQYYNNQNQTGNYTQSYAGNQYYTNNTMQNSVINNSVVSQLRSFCQSPIYIVTAILVTIYSILSINGIEETSSILYYVVALFDSDSADIYELVKNISIFMNIAVVAGVWLIFAFSFSKNIDAKIGATILQIVTIVYGLVYILAACFIVIQYIDNEEYISYIFEYGNSEAQMTIILVPVILGLFGSLYEKIALVLKNFKNTVSLDTVTSYIGVFVPVMLFIIAFFYLFIVIGDIEIMGMPIEVEMDFNIFMTIATNVMCGIAVLAYRNKLMSIKGIG